MSGEVEFKGIDSKDEVKINVEQSSGPKKPSDREVAQYSKLRLALVIFFGMVIIAMVAAAVIIIIVSPRCAKAKGKLDKSWLKEGVVYQIYPRSFKDSNGNGIGDLKGIIEKIEYLKELQVKVIRLYSIYDLNNQTQINSDYGNMEDFDEFLKKAHEQKMKVLLDFIPNHTPDTHPWFLESKKSKDDEKRSWYIWKDGKIGSNGTKEPPNNWLSVSSGAEAWTYDLTTNQYFLHQFNKNQPDLNLTNSEVKEALKNVMKFWLDKGVDGFVARDVQYMVEDSSFLDEQKSGLNSSNKYETLRHSRTYDLIDNVAVLLEWKKFMDEKFTDSYRALIVDVKGDPSIMKKFQNCSDYALNKELITKVGKTSTGENINKTIHSYLGSMKQQTIHNWVLGDSENQRVAHRMGNDLVDALNVLILTLPGVAVTYYGEEIGIRGAEAMSPMQWTDGSYAGFSNTAPWESIGPDYKTINVKTENSQDGISSLKTYKNLMKLRSQSALKSKTFKVVQADRQMLAYTRGDEDKLLVVINFDKAEWNGDLEKLSGQGKIIIDTQDAKNTKTLDVNRIKLAGGQAQVLKMTAEY